MNKEEKILKTLKDFGRLPTARIAAITGINYNTLTVQLDSMLEKETIFREKETVATYWSVK